MALGIPYQVHFTDPTVPGKDSFIIQPGTTDGPLTPITESPDSSANAIHTSLVLPGMGLVTYGQRVAETLVHLLENFASATPPVAPTIGQLWYDYGNEITKVWDGSQWQYVGSPWVYIASTDEYNAMVNLYNLIAGPATGTGTNAYGYGQITMPTLASNVKPQPSDWQTLYNNIVNLCGHQGTSQSMTLTDFRVYSDPKVQTFGIASLLNWYQIWLATLQACSANRFSVDPTTLETTVPSSGNSTRTTQWDSTIQQQVVFTFADDAHMKAFFNAGSSISVTPSINSNAGAANAAWYTLFTQLGSFKLTANGVSRSGSMIVDTGHSEYTGNPSYTGVAPGVVPGGFYALYNAGDNVNVKLFYAGLGGSINAYNGVTGFWVVGSKNSANGTLTLTVNLVNANLQNGTTGSTAGTQYLYNSPGMVGSSQYPATIMSSQTLTKPAPIHLANPEVPYPAVTATILLSQNGVAGTFPHYH